MRVLVLGHKGLVGGAVKRRLEREPDVTVLVDTVKFDLRASSAIEMIFDRCRKIDALVLCAARVGGIQANATKGWQFVRDNLKIQTNVLDYAAKRGVENLVFLGSTCVYPRDAKNPISESALLSGSLEPTNRPYAIAKLAGIEMVRQQNEIGRAWTTLMPSNVYGPGDTFDPGAHVIPELIRKFVEATHRPTPSATQPVSGVFRPVEVWGDPEDPTYREFLYVDDLAEAVHATLALPGKPRWIYNIGGSNTVSIPTLARMIQKCVGHEGPIVWNKDAPTGAPARFLDSAAFFAQTGWAPSVSLTTGLERTVRWYLENRA